MPQLPDASLQLKRFVLPTTENLPEDQQAWVDMNVGRFLLKDTLAIEHTDTIQQANFDLLMMRLKDWNYTDANGQRQKITRENVEVAIDPLDFQFLINQLEEVDKATNVSETEPRSLEDKKKVISSDTSDSAVQQ